MGGGGGSVKDVKVKGELDGLRQSGAPVILHFWASWCEASKHMDQVFSRLSTDFPNTHFLRVLLLFPANSEISILEIKFKNFRWFFL